MNNVQLIFINFRQNFMYIYILNNFICMRPNQKSIILMRLYCKTVKTKYGHALFNKFGNKMYRINCHLDNYGNL